MGIEWTLYDQDLILRNLFLYFFLISLATRFTLKVLLLKLSSIESMVFWEIDPRYHSLKRWSSMRYLYVLEFR